MHASSQVRAAALVGDLLRSWIQHQHQHQKKRPGGGGSSSSSSRPRSSSLLVVRASDILGDFGARDPTTIELESNFGDKVIGFAGTDHNILIPSASQFGLAEKSCKPLAPGTPALSEDEAKALLRKVMIQSLSLCYCEQLRLQQNVRMTILAAKKPCTINSCQTRSLLQFLYHVQYWLQREPCTDFCEN